MFLNYVAKPTKTLSAFPRITELLSFNKKRHFLRLLWSFSLNIARLSECFIVEIPAIKLIDYMRESFELFMMTTFQLLINYLI